MRRPDNRLDWRDPNMPCLRVAEDVYTGELTTEVVPPREVRAEARRDFKNADLPRYGSDPSYYWSAEARYKKQEARASKLENAAPGCFETCTTPNVCLYAGCKRGGQDEQGYEEGEAP